MTFNEQLQWLVHMASMPGAKDYAWARAKELAACDSGLWPDMHLRLAEAMGGRTNEARSEGRRQPG